MESTVFNSNTLYGCDSPDSYVNISPNNLSFLNSWNNSSLDLNIEELRLSENYSDIFNAEEFPLDQGGRFGKKIKIGNSGEKKLRKS